MQETPSVDYGAESGGSPAPQKKIIHVDMDAFYASVEIRDCPSLRGKPVIVGGMPGTRGVVCTCSYEARKYGVHSAMSANKAYELCPQGIFLRPRGDAYREASRCIHKIFHDYTDIVEPLSLDEAYLDVSINKRPIPYAVRTAKEIRARIFQETGGLTASAGISFNKFFAKVASDLRKPNGMTVILPEFAVHFLDTLPIGKFYGVGRVTEKIFLDMGVKNGADLRKMPRTDLLEIFGKNGAFYYEIARGIDRREVCANWERKSLGTEETFDSDMDDLVALYEILRSQAQELSGDLKKKMLAGRTVTLKVKFFDFRCITRSRSLDHYCDDANEIATICKELLLNTEAGRIKVRLIGITVSNFPEHDNAASSAETREEKSLYQPCFDFYQQENW